MRTETRKGETMNQTLDTDTSVHLGNHDNGSPCKCSECGALLTNPGYQKTTTMHCGRSQPWYEFDYRDVAAIRDSAGCWHIWMMDSNGEMPERELKGFNKGRGYTTLQGAKRAWAKMRS